jgi:co-chaperonin GroES (HSP10)
MVKKSQLNYTPVSGYLLTEPLEANQAVGWNAESDDEKPQLAKVLKVGPETWHETHGKRLKAPCKIGDTIIHSSFGFENIIIDGKDYRMVPFNKVLMVKS